MSRERLHPGINLGATDPEAHEEAEETIFGFWVFLMSDLVLFALLFATYATMLGGTAGGPGPADILDLSSSALETAILLASSFTFGLTSLAMKHRPQRVVLWLAVSLLLGLAFLGLELREFLGLLARGAGPDRSGYLSAFFALVGMHGIHVSAGCLWLLTLLGQIAVHGLDRQTKLGVMRLALFWHMLDIVWIGIFSVVYLQGLAQ